MEEKIKKLLKKSWIEGYIECTIDNGVTWGFEEWLKDIQSEIDEITKDNKTCEIFLPNNKFTSVTKYESCGRDTWEHLCYNWQKNNS